MDAHFAVSFQTKTSNAHAHGEWPGQIRSGRRGATSRLRYNAPLRKTYLALYEGGKPWKGAITAVMRKLIILANALIRDNRKWAEIAP